MINQIDRVLGGHRGRRVSSGDLSSEVAAKSVQSWAVIGAVGRRRASSGAVVRLVRHRAPAKDQEKGRGSRGFLVLTSVLWLQDMGAGVQGPDRSGFKQTRAGIVNRPPRLITIQGGDC